MIRDLGIVQPGTTLYIPFHTFDSNDPSASVTMTGLATTDIEIYKDGSTTQRASDAGYALLDTDGIDFDTITGIHGISINLADNTTAGFYAAGSQYWVVVSSITVDAATINFVLCTFRIGYEGAVLNTTIATLASQTSFTLTNGPAEDDALNNCQIVIHDVASAVQVGRAVILDYTGSTKTVTLAAGTTFTAAASDNVAVLGLAPLIPTTAGRTLDVSTGGEAGVDWANVGTPSSTVNLSATTVSQVETLLAGSMQDVLSDIAARVWEEDATGHQTQGTFGQAIGDPGADTNSIYKAVVTDATGATVGVDVAAVLVDTAEIGAAGAGLTVLATAAELAKVPKSDGTATWNATALASIQTEANDAIVANRLDELLAADSDIDGAAPPTVGSVFHELMTKTAGSFTYDQTTDSLEAVRDRGDAAWITATGFSTHSAADIWAVGTRVLTAGTNIQLPSNGLANVTAWTVDITGSLSGSVGSVTGAVGSVTGNVGGNVTGSIGSLATQAKADVNTEVDGAIETYHLDHLLAVTYDPASKPGVADALLNELVESDAGVARFTANALEQGPTGGSAPTVSQIADEVQTRTIAAVTTVNGLAANTITAASIATGAFDADALTTDAGVEIAAAVWDRVLNAANHNIASSAGRRLRQLDASSILSGTAAAGASNSITLDGTASPTDDIYDENLIVITGGTGVGQTRVIVEYNGTTKVAIVNRVWQTNPSTDSTYDIIAGAQADIAQHGLAQGGTASTITLSAAASAVDDIYIGSQVYISTSTGTGQTRLITDYNGTTKVATVSPDWVTNPTSASVYKVIPIGRAIVDSGTVTTVTGSVGSVTGAVGSVTGNVGGNVTGSVGSVVGAVGSVTGAVGSVAGNVGGNVTGSVGSVLGGINTTGGTITTLDALDTAQDSQHATTQGLVTTVDTVVDAIKVKTDLLPTDPADQSAVEAAITAATSPLATQASVNTIDDFLDTEVAAIKAKTDSLTFTVAGQVDANIQYVNDTRVDGTGATGDEWGPV